MALRHAIWRLRMRAANTILRGALALSYAIKPPIELPKLNPPREGTYR